MEVTTDTQVDVLLNAVRYGQKNKPGNSNVEVNRTMVFTNTVDASESVAIILQKADIKCLSYHSETSLEERAKNLTIFRESGGVLVCTDAAARGLDIPNVSHVIQARHCCSITSVSFYFITFLLGQYLHVLLCHSCPSWIFHNQIFDLCLC